MAAGGPTDDASQLTADTHTHQTLTLHRLVVQDICDINEIVGDYRWSEIAEIYAAAVNDGSVRTIGGFAVGEGKKHGVDTYYGTPTPLDDFVSAA